MLTLKWRLVTKKRLPLRRAMSQLYERRKYKYAECIATGTEKYDFALLFLAINQRGRIEFFKVVRCGSYAPHETRVRIYLAGWRE